MALPPRPGSNGLVPSWARQRPTVHGARAPVDPPADDEGDAPRGAGTRFRSVTDPEGRPVELRGDHGGEPHQIPAGLDGLSAMRPSKLLARYQALLAEPVERFDEDVGPDGTVTRRLAGRGMHLELAMHAGGVPQGIREAAVAKLNEHEGSERYLLTAGGVRDLVDEAKQLALDDEDRKALALLGGGDVAALLRLAEPTAAEEMAAREGSVARLEDRMGADSGTAVQDAEFEPVAAGGMDQRDDNAPPGDEQADDEVRVDEASGDVDPVPDTETVEEVAKPPVRWWHRLLARVVLFLPPWLALRIMGGGS